MRNKILGFFLVFGLLVGLSGCNFNSGNSTSNKVAEDEQGKSAAALQQLHKNQPIHLYKHSQIMATTQAVEDAQANTVITTSFFFNQGVVDPIDSCPSLGVPIPAGTELTSPDQKIHADGNSSVVVSQADPTGVYMPPTTGTYVACVAPDGSAYLNYWEGFVKMVSGPAKWDYTNHKIVLVGPSSVKIQQPGK